MERESFNPQGVSIEVTQGIPEEKEAFLLMLELSAGRTLCRFLGPRWKKIFERLFQQETTLFGFPHCFVLRQGETVLGMALGWNGKARKAKGWATVLRLLPHALFHVTPSLLWEIFHMGLPQEAYYVSNIAVFPPHQGKGLGSFFLNFLEEEARKCGAKRVILDVEKENERALHFYRRQGYAVLYESHHFVRMGKEAYDEHRPPW